MNKDFTSSRLQHRLTLQECIRSPDGGGGYTTIWQDVADLWGEIHTLSAREVFAAEQLQHRSTHRITIRARTGVTPNMRVVHEERQYFIQGIIPPYIDGKGIMQLLTQEGIAE